MEEVQNASWDIKKILIALVLIATAGLGFKTFVLDQKGSKSLNNQSVSVQGASTSEIPNSSPAVVSDIKKDVEKKINELNKEVNNINVVEIATSTPAVKKILNDLKNLEKLPQNQARQTCLQICNGL